MINDYLKKSLINIKRNKKNKILIVIFTLLLFLLFIDTIIIKNFYEYYDYAVNSNIGFRTLSVFYNIESDEEATSTLKNIEHVTDVYKGLYNSIGVQSNIYDNGADGWIGLNYGTINTVPKSIKGKQVSEINPGEIICPYEFYPDGDYGNPLNIDETKFLSYKDTLNREILLTYYLNNTKIVNNEVVEEKTELTKKMKIVGLYDEKIFRNGINVCYASPDDIKDIVDAYNASLDNEMYYPFNVVVDKEENVEKVKNMINKIQGYEISENTVAYIDKGFTSILFSVTFIIGLTIIITILFVLKNYINKKIKDESKYIGVLRSCGYTKKQVIICEIFENSIVMLISFIISTVIFSSIFKLLENNFFKYYKYIGFNISNNIIVLLIIFMIVIAISESVNYFLLNKHLRNPISDILKDE